MSIDKKTTKFISKSIEIHKNRYKYSKSIFMNSHSKLIITCDQHGDFLMTPANHLSGQGCPKCGRLQTTLSRLSNLETFIKKSITIHENRYDYSKTVYYKNKIKLIITCHEHGDFKISPDKHLSGQGCPVCACINYSSLRRSSVNEFIQKAELIHGIGKYEYLKSHYTNSFTKLTITCPIHGDFEQSPDKHLSGRGCKKCGINNMIKKQSLTTKEFIKKSNNLHKGKYDYSETIYIRRKDKVKIICYKHGPFYMLPGNHLKGNGCPVCSCSKGELAIADILIEHNINFIREYRLPESTTRHRYDFYLPDYRLLIEFHGIHHYQPIEFFGGIEHLKTVRFSDNYKKVFAKETKYNIIYFNYRQFKNIKNFKHFVLNKIVRYKKFDQSTD